MHERLIQHISSHEGVRWVTFDEIADDFAKRNPRKKRLKLNNYKSRIRSY